MKNNALLIAIIAAGGAGLYFWQRSRSQVASTTNQNDNLNKLLNDSWNPFNLNNAWDTVSPLPSPLYQPDLPGAFGADVGTHLTDSDYLYNLSTQPSLNTSSAATGGATYMTKKWDTPAIGDLGPDKLGNLTERVTFDGRKYDGYFRDAEIKYGLPQGLLSRLAWQESRYNPNAISPVGALGMMQIMPSTAAAYGWNVADLSKPEKAIGYAARILKDNYGYIKPATARSWPAAIVAYNQGPNNVNKAIAAKGPIPTDWIEWFAQNAKPDGYGYFNIAYDIGLTPASIGLYPPSNNVAGLRPRPKTRG